MRENSIFGDHLGGFSVCIHRGARQIGGTCIELACEDQRILLDLGLPLDAGDEDPTSLLPENDGLKVADPSLLALIVSHGHADHWGLASQVSHLPIITGAATRRMLRAAAPFVPRPIPDGIDAPGVPDLLAHSQSRHIWSIIRPTTPTPC
jgi:ribonuclease J